MEATAAMSVAGGLLAYTGTVGGALFWFGRLQGQLAELTKNNTEQKEELEKTKGRLEQIWKTQNEQATMLGRFDEKFGNLERSFDVLYKKIDSMTELLIHHTGRKSGK